MLFQSDSSPITQRQQIRVLSIAAGALAIVIGGSPYISGFMQAKDQQQQAIQQKTDNDSKWSRLQKESEARVRHNQLKSQETRQIAQSRLINGCVFYDSPISEGMNAIATYQEKGQIKQRPIANGTVLCDGNQTTAIVQDGKATDVRALGTKAGIQK